MTGRQRVSVMVFGISTGLNLILNLLLIPPYGILGAAVATTITVIFWNLAFVLFNIIRLGINPTVFSTLRNDDS
jgi:O-antigen/teichoic acid export membrane protein